MNTIDVTETEATAAPTTQSTSLIRVPLNRRSSGPRAGSDSRSSRGRTVPEPDPEGVDTVTGLAGTASYPVFGAAGAKVSFLAHYFPGAGGGNAVEKAMIAGVEKEGGTPDLFSTDGFTAAQMIVRAVEEGSATDTDAMVKALEGWSFDGVKGEQRIRAEDHALLQPMFQAKLVRDGDAWKPELVKTVSAEEAAPPEKQQ